jgi:hypothetical protein
MPMYMDVHDIPGVKAADVVGAHEADVRVQGQYGVEYGNYWVDEKDGKVFCLVDAPDKETATRVHREASGCAHAVRGQAGRLIVQSPAPHISGRSARLGTDLHPRRDRPEHASGNCRSFCSPTNSDDRFGPARALRSFREGDRRGRIDNCGRLPGRPAGLPAG